MRKIALSLIAAAVLCVGFGNVAYALQPSGMAFYDVGAWPAWPGYNCDQTTSGGVGAWFTYWQKGGAGGGYLESNLNSAGNAEPHPSAFDTTPGNIVGDEGLFSNTNYAAQMGDAALYSDDPQVPQAGDTLVYVAAYACKAGDCAAAAPGDCYNPVDFATSTDSTLHFVYGAGVLTEALSGATAAFYNFGQVTLASPAAAMDHPAQGASTKVTGAYKGVGNQNWVHLEFDEAVMPGPPAGALGGFPVPTANFVPAACGNPNGDLEHGIRVLSSTVAIGTAVPADYALVYDATQDFAGLGGVTGAWGINGNTNDNFVNHDIDALANPGLNYISQPMIGPDALNPDGVPILIHAGSWGSPGPAAPAGGLPTPATVVSFDASFDPRTGKVTLNWRSAAEQSLDGYNVWRQLNLDGRPLGEKALVGFVPAKGPGEYSLTDEPDVKGFARLARGRPIEATYSLEEVNLDGTTNVIKTTSVQITKTARRSR
jgi:hypothetical protein